MYDPTIGRWSTENPSGLGPDVNPYRFVGNDPTNAVDSTGLYVEIVNILQTEAATLIKAKFASDIPRQTRELNDLVPKSRAANQRLAPTAVKDAVAAALKGLKVDVEPSIGDETKANLTDEDFKKIKATLKDKLEGGITTISGTEAWRVKLNDTWELKIYAKSDGGTVKYSAAVGKLTEGWPHKIDALLWLTGVTNPNGANAEHYLGRYYYDGPTLAALNELRKLGFKGATPFDAVLADWVKGGMKTDIGINYIAIPNK